MAAEHKIKNEKGQALLELIVFIPFMLTMYVVAINLFGAINGSINQQKATRGYFFARIKGNSNAPNLSQLQDYANQGVRAGGMLALGWRINPFNSSIDTPQANCYKLATLTPVSDIDECEDKIDEPGPTSFFRVMTTFGICGKTYTIQNNSYTTLDAFAHDASCTLQR